MKMLLPIYMTSCSVFLHSVFCISVVRQKQWVVLLGQTGTISLFPTEKKLKGGANLRRPSRVPESEASKIASPSTLH